MASLNELKEALLQTLAAKGSLGQIKARIRSEIFNSLDQNDDSLQKPALSNTNLLINELIREYLAFNQYRYSLNVFLPETNQPEVPPFDRSFIAKELHVQENQHSVQIPLLYSVIALLQQNKVGEASSSGVNMSDPASAFPSHPLSASVSSSVSSNQQPGYSAAQHHQPAASAAFNSQHSQRSQVEHADFGSEAPKPLHFVNRM